MALFNTIDKDLDQYVESDGFMPFNEKVKYIINLHIPISNVLAMYEQPLRLFGEIRNHLVHSFKLDGATYLLPTDDAMKELEHLVSLITQPPQCHAVCREIPYSAQVHDSILSIMNIMKQKRIEHVPVLDQGRYMCSLSYVLICDRITAHPDRDITKDLTVSTLLEEQSGDVLFPWHERGYYYHFLPSHATIYEAQHMFESKKYQLGAIYVTHDGSSTAPLVGMMTALDMTVLLSTI